MKHERYNGNLVITVEAEEQEELLELADELGERFCADVHMHSIFEDLLANSELEWVEPAEVGCLTSAPLLGARNEAGKVVECWGFMDYQLRSPQEDLAVYRRVVFVSG